MAPEYKQGGCVSLKTDVYSFGATLLEIVRGSRIPPSTLELSDESRDFGPLNKWVSAHLSELHRQPQYIQSWSLINQ